MVNHTRFFHAALAATLFVTFGVTRPVHAQWVQTNGPWGGTVISLASLGSEVFAGTDGDGVFRSTDSGVTWTPVNKGIVLQDIFGIQVHALATLGNYLFAGTDVGGVFRSTDDGESWDRIDTGLRIPYVQSLLVQGTTLFALSGGLFRSTDSGLTWSDAAIAFPGENITAIATTGTTLFASMLDFGVWRSTDEGAHWKAANNGLPSRAVGMLYATGPNLFLSVRIADTATRMFRSTDNGESWTATGAGITNLNVGIPAIIANGTGLLAATDGAGIFQSTDSGATWTAEASDGLTDHSVQALAANGTSVFAGSSYGGVFRSTDNGASWNSSSEGMMRLDVSSMFPAGANLFADIVNYGMFRTSDAGTNWTWASSGFDDQIQAMANIGSNIIAAGENTTIYRSTDDGASWTQDSNGLTHAWDLAASATKLFAAGRDDTISGVFLSTDSGVSWTLTAGMGLLRSPSAIFAVGSNLFATVDTSTRIYFPNDPPDYYEIIFLSTDNGATWRPASTGLPAHIAIRSYAAIGTNLFVLADSGYFSGEMAGIFRSTDSGTSWTRSSADLPDSMLYTLIASGTNLLAGTETAGVLLSRDSGANWTVVNGALMDSTVMRLVVAGPDLYAMAGSSYPTTVWRRPLSEMIPPSAVSEPTIAASQIQSYPNPFSQSTTISFTTPERGAAEVSVINLLGSEVARLFAGELAVGPHSFTWDAREMPPGMYECIVRMNGGVERVPMVLTR